MTALHTNDTANISVVTEASISLFVQINGKLWLKFKSSNSCERTRFDDERGGTDAPCRRDGYSTNKTLLYLKQHRVVFDVLYLYCASCASLRGRGNSSLSIVRVRDMLRFFDGKPSIVWENFVFSQFKCKWHWWLVYSNVRRCNEESS